MRHSEVRLIPLDALNVARKRVSSPAARLESLSCKLTLAFDFNKVLWAADDAEAVFNESAIS